MMDADMIRTAARFEQDRRAVNKTLPPEEKVAAMSNYSTQQLNDAAVLGTALSVEETRTS